MVAQLFEHILVPLDFTAKNAAALQCAMRLATQNYARVTLMHVIETIEYVEDEEIERFYESLKLRASANLACCGEQFREANVPVAEKIVLGKRAHAIVSYALQKEADLIVLSSHKIDLDEAPQNWATLSYQVSIMAQCPVLLVK